jgi:hypothetical protein
MSRAYSVMVRPLENLPVRATFRIAFRARSEGARYAWPALPQPIIGETLERTPVPRQERGEEPGQAGRYPR